MTALGDFRVAAGLPEPGPTREGGWRPLELDRLRPGLVLGVDPSLRSTGWALLWRDGAGCRVLEAGKLTTTAPDGPVNWVSRQQDGDSICRQMEELLYGLVPDHARAAAAAASNGQQLVVHMEKPATGRVVRDPYSSAMAGQGVRTACRLAGVQVTAVSAQSAKHLLTGRRGGEKQATAAALRALGWLDGIELLKNDDVRDAGAIALHRLSVGA